MGTDVGKRSRVLTRNLGSPVVGAVAAVLAAVTDDGTEQTISSGFTDPDVPRNITATAGGTATDIKAIQVTINGTNESGEVITEDLPAFTVNTAGTVVGSLAFKTVTSVVIPAHDGTGATTSIGHGAKLGLGVILDRDTIVNAYFGGVLEGTRPTVAFDDAEMDKNLVTLNSTLDGSEVLVDYYLP